MLSGYRLPVVVGAGLMGLTLAACNPSGAVGHGQIRQPTSQTGSTSSSTTSTTAVYTTGNPVTSPSVPNELTIYCGGNSNGISQEVTSQVTCADAQAIVDPAGGRCLSGSTNTTSQLCDYYARGFHCLVNPSPSGGADYSCLSGTREIRYHLQ